MAMPFHHHFQNIDAGNIESEKKHQKKTHTKKKNIHTKKNKRRRQLCPLPGSIGCHIANIITHRFYHYDASLLDPLHDISSHPAKWAGQQLTFYEVDNDHKRRARPSCSGLVTATTHLTSLNHHRPVLVTESWLQEKHP